MSSTADVSILPAPKANSKVLIVGAGKLGCEILKNLAAIGFLNLEIIDAGLVNNSDQGLLQLHESSLGKPKVSVAENVMQILKSDAKVAYHHKSIDSAEYGYKFFQEFSLVINTLNSNEINKHVNNMCLESNIPMIESGSTDCDIEVKFLTQELSQFRYEVKLLLENIQAVGKTEETLAGLVALQAFGLTSNHLDLCQSMHSKPKESKDHQTCSQNQMDEIMISSDTSSKKLASAEETIIFIEEMKKRMGEKDFVNVGFELDSFITNKINLLVPESGEIYFLHGQNCLHLVHEIPHKFSSEQIKSIVAVGCAALEIFVVEKKKTSAVDRMLVDSHFLLHELYSIKGDTTNSIVKMQNLIDIISSNTDQYSKELIKAHKILGFLNFSQALRQSDAYLFNEFEIDEEARSENELLKRLYESVLKLSKVQYKTLHVSSFYSNLRKIIDCLEEKKAPKPLECFSISDSDRNFVEFSLFMQINMQNSEEHVDHVVQKIKDNNPLLCVIHEPFLARKLLKKKLSDRYHIKCGNVTDFKRLKVVVLIRKMMIEDSINISPFTNFHYNSITIYSPLYVEPLYLVALTTENLESFSYEREIKNVTGSVKNGSCAPTMVFYHSEVTNLISQNLWKISLRNKSWNV